MNKHIILICVVILAIVIAFWAINIRITEVPDSGGSMACTAEVRGCPDGSAVGRTGPNCEFAPCPVTDPEVSGGGGIMPFNSGVRGTVSLGPTCPVERIPPDPDCADKPYATAITAYRSGSTSPFIIGNSDTDGIFELSLSPGSYKLIAGNGTNLPSCSPVDVTVGPSGYTSVNISCDTGIR